MAKQITLKVGNELKKLQKNMDLLSEKLTAEVNQAVKEAAYAAHASIVAKAQQQLSKTRQDYLKGIEIHELGDNSYMISLEGDWPNKLEEGFPAFNIAEKLLQSKKTVEVGSRAGQPWVQTSKPQKKGAASHKFAHVPFERQPFSKAAATSDMASAIKAMQGQGLNGIKQLITHTFKDPMGNPMEGKVATGKSDNPMVDNLVKYQKIYQNDKGKQSVQSVYINYRTVSEKGKPWIHPGYSGLHAFEEAERDLVKNIELIIKTLL